MSEWDKVRILTKHIHSCQSEGGVTYREDQAEERALRRQVDEVTRGLSREASKFLKSRGFTAGGSKRKVRR